MNEAHVLNSQERLLNDTEIDALIEKQKQHVKDIVSSTLGEVNGVEKCLENVLAQYDEILVIEK